MRFAEIFKTELFSKYKQKAGCYINEIYDIMIEVLKKLNIEKKAYFTFKIMTEFYEYEFLSEMLSRLDEYKSGDDEMKAIHDTKNKTTIYRDETFFEKTFARG